MMLDKIISAQKRRLDSRRRDNWEAGLREKLENPLPAVSFADALIKENKISLIAEFKRKSPSMGTINDTVDPTKQAVLYEKGGASAVSVLTEEDYFGGNLDDISRIKSTVNLPVLRKDFILDPIQILEAKAYGANAVLLIVTIVGKMTLCSLLGEAKRYELDCLCEVHTEDEIDIALSCGARIIGINNRDLDTFKIDLDVTRRLRPRIPSDIIVVSESGIHSAEDVRIVRDSGVDAILVGTELMRAEDVSGKISEILT